jgi:hypothetical protein
MYRKPDPETKIYQRASGKVHIYNVEITKFIKKVLPDLKNKPYDPITPRLHYWLWALCESQTNGVPLTEVIQMSVALQEFVKTDNGFGQYAERYEDVSSDLVVRRQFAAWTAEMDKLDIWKAIGREEGIEIGIEKGIEKGIQKEKEKSKEKETNAILRLVQTGMELATISAVYDKSEEEIKLLIASQ